MAKTRFKGKKTTSGVAPRKRLNQLLTDGDVLAKRVKRVSLDGDEGACVEASKSSDALEDKDDPDAAFCNRCDDGGTTVVECDKCDRVHCRNCVAYEISDQQLGEVYYLCFQCHIEEERGGPARPYMGLYERAVDVDGNVTRGKPLRSAFLRITGLPSAIPSQRVVTTPLAIIHLQLSTCFTTSTEFVSSIITPYFERDKLKGRILVKEVRFNLGSPQGKGAYTSAIKGLVKALKALKLSPKGRPRALIIVSTHSDANRGDLFVEPKGSYDHPDFFTAIFPQDLRDAVATFDCTYLFMVCGAFVSIPRSLDSLKKVVYEQRLENVITFTAPQLQPDLVKPFLLQLMLQKFVRGYLLSKILPRILSEIEPRFGRHTGVIHLGYITGQEGKGWEHSVPVTKYLWHSGTIQPWGNPIPDQCPECGCLRRWNFGKPDLTVVKTITVRCMGNKRGQEAEAEGSPSLPPASAVEMAVGRDRGQTRRNEREEMQLQAAALDRDDTDDDLTPCKHTIVCDPPAGFKWVKSVSVQVEGKWMALKA
ncbi:hypothetical protein DENSPDRAFT_882494 [Dentipellis sp. KUC8613]|nr:hypothetical protein DENSPDRAFT_882494 [Dentipellis sp. KUC8613]